MLLSFKTKLKLTNSQKQLIAKHAGIARFTFNWGLATWQDLYESGLKPNKYLLKKFFNNHVKPEYEWIKEKGICQRITQYAFDQLGNSFDRFFKGQAKYPKFKKKGLHDSFTIDAGGKPISVGGTSIKLPTIGWVKTFEGLPHITTTKLTISRIARKPSGDKSPDRTAHDDWYIAFAYEQQRQITEKSIDVVGVDLGVKTLATLSTGVVFPNSKQYQKSLTKLKRLSKKLTRKDKGSNRRKKARIKLANIHAKVAFTRKDTLHKITTYLCKNHAKIVVEDLNVSGMLKNDKLSQSIADCGFHELKRQLLYKAEKFGSQIILADRWKPSSKLCSACGHKQDMPLSERVYQDRTRSPKPRVFKPGM